MKTVLFRDALVGVLTAFVVYAQSNGATRYTVTDLGTLGGPFSVAFGINSAGRVGGEGAMPNGNVHAYLTGIGGTKFDLGTLGGPNSQANRPDGMMDVSIVSETSMPDPLKEDFCGFGSHLVCLGARMEWRYDAPSNSGRQQCDGDWLEQSRPDYRSRREWHA